MSKSAPSTDSRAFPTLSKRHNLRLRALWKKATEAPWQSGWDYKPLSRHENDPWFVGNACGPQHYPVKESDAEQWRKMQDQIQADSAFLNALVNAYHEAMTGEKL